MFHLFRKGDVQSSRKSLTIIILAVFVFFVVRACVSSSGDSPTATTENITSITAESPKEEPISIITTDARDLYYYYHENEIAADNFYRGKKVAVVGKVTSIAKDFLDKPYVTLATGTMFNSIHCDVVNASSLINLKKGQRATFVGKCRGMIMGSIFIDDCEYIKP